MVARSHLLQVAPIAAELRAEFAAAMRLERLGVIDYARTIRLPDGDFKGDTYEPARHPAQMCLLQAIDAGATWVAVAKPVQDGGSLATTAPVLRRVAHLHQSVMVAYPTQDKAKDAWTLKLWPMLEAQGGMQPRSGGGSRGGAARVAALPGGGRFLLRSAGGRGESGQAGDSCDVLDIEEVDDWADMRRLRLIERRISKSPDPLLLYVSTVKRDGTGAASSLILRLVELGTGTRLRYPCIHCGAVQAFDWEQVDVDRGVIRCAHCPGVMDEAQRQQALKHWSRHDARRTPLFSIIWTALDSPFPIVVNGTRQPVLPGLCAEYKQAVDAVAIGDHGLMRQFYRDRLTRTYTGDQQLDDDAKDTPHTHRTLAIRSESTAWAEVVEDSHEGKLWSRYSVAAPDAAQLLVGVFDVQRNRLYAGGVAIDQERRTYDCAWGIERARAGDDGREPPPWAPGELSETLTRAADWLEERYGDLFRVGVVDVSDGETVDELAAWLARRPRWNAIQGESDLPAERKDGTLRHCTAMLAWDTRWRPGLGSYRVVTALAQQQVLSAYKIDPAAPGAALLPGPLRAGNTYLRHLTAVGWTKSSDGRPVWCDGRHRKLPGAGRHDYMDCRAYATAVALHSLTKPTTRRPIGKIGSFI